MWGMFCHLSTLCGYVMPFGNILGPLVVWLIKKDEYPLVDDQGKEALNFQISITIWTVIAAILCIIIIGIPSDDDEHFCFACILSGCRFPRGRSGVSSVHSEPLTAP